MPETEFTHKHEFECDRCAASAWFYPEEKIIQGLGCDCGGAWIDVTGPEPMQGEPEPDFSTLLLMRGVCNGQYPHADH